MRAVGVDRGGCRGAEVDVDGDRDADVGCGAPHAVDTSDVRVGTRAAPRGARGEQGDAARERDRAQRRTEVPLEARNLGISRCPSRRPRAASSDPLLATNATRMATANPVLVRIGRGTAGSRTHSARRPDPPRNVPTHDTDRGRALAVPGEVAAGRATRRGPRSPSRGSRATARFGIVDDATGLVLTARREPQLLHASAVARRRRR